MNEQNKIQFINSFEDAWHITLLAIKYLKDNHNIIVNAKPSRSTKSNPNKLPNHLQYHVSLSNLNDTNIDQMNHVRKVLYLNNISFDTGFGGDVYDWEIDWSFSWSKIDKDNIELSIFEMYTSDVIDSMLDFISYYNHNKSLSNETLLKELYGIVVFNYLNN